MDLNKLRYSKTVAVKDMEAHSDKTEKAAVSEKDKSLSVGKMSSDYLKGEATIETKIVFIISGGDKREKDYFKMLMKDRHIRRLKNRLCFQERTRSCAKPNVRACKGISFQQKVCNRDRQFQYRC